MNSCCLDLMLLKGMNLKMRLQIWRMGQITLDPKASEYGFSCG